MLCGLLTKLGGQIDRHYRRLARLIGADIGLDRPIKAQQECYPQRDPLPVGAAMRRPKAARDVTMIGGRRRRLTLVDNTTPQFYDPVDPC